MRFFKLTAWVALFVSATICYSLHGVLTVLARNSEGTTDFKFSSVILVSEIVKLLIAFACFIKGEWGTRSLKQSFWHVWTRDSWRFAVPGLVYAASNNLSFHLIKYMDPATWQVLANVRILTTAVLFRMVFKKTFENRQIFALILLFVGCSFMVSTSYVRPSRAKYLTPLIRTSLAPLTANHTMFSPPTTTTTTFPSLPPVAAGPLYGIDGVLTFDGAGVPVDPVDPVGAIEFDPDLVMHMPVKRFITLLGLVGLPIYAMLSAIAGVYTEWIFKRDTNTTTRAPANTPTPAVPPPVELGVVERGEATTRGSRAPRSVAAAPTPPVTSPTVSQSLHAQNLQLYAFGIIINFCAFLWESRGDVGPPGSGLLRGYNTYTWVMLANQALVGLMVSMVMKYGNNIAKLFISAASMSLTGGMDKVLFHHKLGFSFWMGTFALTISIFAYNVSAGQLLRLRAKTCQFVQRPTKSLLPI